MPHLKQASLASTPDGSITSRKLIVGARRRGSRPSGALGETMPRTSAVLNSSTSPASGTLRLALLEQPLVAGETVTSISVMSGTPTAASLTHQIFGLYDVTTLALLARTTDDTSTAWAASTVKTLSLTPGTYTPTVDTNAYIGVLVVAGTVPGSVFGTANAAGIAGMTPPLGGNSSTGLTDLPDPAGAITAGGPLYAYIS